MLFVSSASATTSSASGSIATPSTVAGCAAASGSVESARIPARRRTSQWAMAGVSYARQATLGIRRFPMASSSKSAAVRARLQHPVIDGDGHWLEPLPIFLDYLQDVAGPSVVDKFVRAE